MRLRRPKRYLRGYQKISSVLFCHHLFSSQMLRVDDFSNTSEPLGRACADSRDRSRSPGRNQRSVERLQITPVSTPTLSSLDCSKFSVTITGKNSYGGPLVLLSYGEGGESLPKVQLYEEGEGCRIVFPIDTTGRPGQELPHFLGGKENDKKVETLDVTLEVNPKQVECITKVETWLKEQAQANSKEWFGSSLNKDIIEVMFHSCLSHHEKYGCSLRTKLNVASTSARKDILTNFVYVNAAKELTRGSGWSFLQPLLADQGWKGYNSLPILEFRGVWVVGKKFGLRTTIYEMMVLEKPREKTEAFSDANIQNLLSTYSA